MTLTDWATRYTNGEQDENVIIEILNETNEIFNFWPSMEANSATGHTHTVRTGIPEPTWRNMYQGVMPTKSETAKVTDTIGNLEAYSEPDKDEADLNGNTAKFRMDEAVAHIEGMGQSMAETIFYGNTNINPERFMGLAPRYNTGDTAAANNAVNVIDGGGTGSNNTSIWLISPGDRSVCGIYPKGSSAGLSRTDKGQVTVQNSDGSRYEAYQDHFKWQNGLALKDWRSVVRICNIDVTALTRDASGGADLFELIAIALERIDKLGNGAFLACNRTVREYLRTHRLNQTNVRFGQMEAGGSTVTSIDETPLIRCDAILNTEAAVTGF
jgi:hypothetical protein